MPSTIHEYYIYLIFISSKIIELAKSQFYSFLLNNQIQFFYLSYKR